MSSWQELLGFLDADFRGVSDCLRIRRCVLVRGIERRHFFDGVFDLGRLASLTLSVPFERHHCAPRDLGPGTMADIATAKKTLDALKKAHNSGDAVKAASLLGTLKVRARNARCAARSFAGAQIWRFHGRDARERRPRTRD